MKVRRFLAGIASVAAACVGGLYVGATLPQMSWIVPFVGLALAVGVYKWIAGDQW